MACTYTYRDPLTNTISTFQTEAELNNYLEANKASIVKAYNQTKIQNQIIGAKGAQSNRELSRSLNTARDMETNHATKEDIFNRTGWERGADGKWRTKLPTDGIKIDYKKLYDGNILGNTLDYPELYELYPSLKNVKIGSLPAESRTNGSVTATNVGKLFIKLNQRVLESTDKEWKQEVLIHEVQHIVQALEDFYFSPKNIEGNVNDKNFAEYFNSHSEIEARNAARLSLISDDEKQGLTIQATEDIRPDKKTPSNLFSQDFTGGVVFNKDLPFDNLIIPEFKESDTEIDESEVYPELTDNLDEENYPYIKRIINTFSSEIVPKVQSLLESGYVPGSTPSEDSMAAHGIDISKHHNIPLEARMAVSNQIDDDSPRTMVYDTYTDELKYLNELWTNMENGTLNFPVLSQQWLEEFYTKNGPRYIIVDEFDTTVTVIVSEEVFNKKYNENASNPFGTVLNQGTQGAFDTMQRVIYAVTNPNVSTPLHELAHAWEEQLNDAERKTVLDWSGHDNWTRQTSENFARGFEQYLLEGKNKDASVQSLFDKFAKWLSDIYDKIVTGLGLQLNDDMRNVYDIMISAKAMEAKAPSNLIASREQLLNQPNPSPEILNFGTISQIQQALNNGYYEQQLTDKLLDEGQLREVLKTNGLSESAADAVVFRVNNKATTTSIEKEIPKDKYNKAYIKELSKIYNDGTLDQAARSKVVDWQKYYQILDYIGQKTPTTAQAKVSEFVQKFYVKDAIQPIEDIIEEQPVAAATSTDQVQEETPVQEETTNVEEQPVAAEATSTEDITQGTKVVYTGKTYKDLLGTSPLEVQDTHETNANVTDGFATLKYYDREIPLFTLRKATPEEVQTITPSGQEETIASSANDKFSKDDIVTFQGEQYKVNYSFPGLALNDAGKEVSTTMYNVSQVKGAKEFDVPESKITAIKPSIQKQTAKNSILNLISNRFKQIFPQIETEIDSFDFDAPARFYQGRVQLNTNYQGVGLFKEGIAHEYMHPVVAALKLSNVYLYNNLIAELKATQKTLLQETQAKVDKGLYTQDDMLDEALVTYLGREISKAFDEQGIPRDYNEDEVIAARQELSKLNAARKKGEKIDQTNYEQVRAKAEQPSFIEERRQTLVQKFFKWWTDLMDFILGKKKVRPIASFVEAVNKSSKNFVFQSRDNENYGVEFEKQDNKVNVYIDKTMFPDLTSVEVVRQYANRMSELFSDNDEFEAHEKEFNELLDNNRLTYDLKHTDVKGKQNLKVASLHPRMGLNGMVTLMQANLGKQAITPVEYSERELGVIQQLEAYMKMDEEQADVLKQKRDVIVKKIKALGDIATRRIGEGTRFQKLKEDAEYLSKHNVFTASDAEFITDYIKHGADSINTAYRMFNNLKDELADKANLDQPRINRINKEIEQIKQLVAMYDDIRVLYSKYNETFEEQDLTNFTRATERYEILKDSMKQVLAELATEQIMPTVERNNESLRKQGYTKYILNRDDVKKLLINGSTKDIGWFAYMFGAPVNSTDTINAAISNSIADALNYVYSNNLEAINELVDAHKVFKIKGSKEQEAFFKANYLRKAKFWDIISRDATGKPTYGYIEKYAFHQDKLYDLYEDDLRKFKELLPEAKTHEDDIKNQERVNTWVANNKDSQKYINNNFQQLRGDQYYQALYNNYTKYNNKYGENRLAYGIMPQFYHESLMDKWKEKLNGIKDIAAKDKDLKERATKLGDEIFGEQRGVKDKRGLNLDGTVYRSVNSDTTVHKDDSKLNFDLQAVMIDFISDAGNYEAKREVQFNMENIKQLIGGNSFFGIGERTIGTRDFATEFRLKRAAKEKLKTLDQEIKNGKVLTADEQVQYDKLKEEASGNVFKQVYDKLLGRPIKARTARANAQAVEFINDVFYNEDEFPSHVKIGGRTFDLNKTGANLGFVQAIVNMSGNVVAGINNVLAGNMQMFIEASGGKHMTLKDLAVAHGQYTGALLKGDFIGDMKNPIKSEITQYGLLFDAIQGEFTNDLGEKLTGNLMRKFINPSSFFLLTHAGEHQIQLTGMLALMNATKVDTTTGEKISLKQAFAKDQNGRYKLRNDVKWSKEDKQQFVRTLHGVSRTLNGNYNSLHKGHLQRYWYGKLMMQYRKYLYPAIVARYGQERLDLEKGTVEAGYLRFFVGTYLFKNMMQRQFNFLKNYKNLSSDQKYMARKAFAELTAYALLTIIAVGMGSGNPEKIKNMSQAEKALLLFTIRVHNEIGMYHVDAGSEFLKQTQNPIASMRFISGIAKFGTQIFHPTDVYKQDGNGYKAGDSKMWHTFHQLLPKIITMPADKFSIDWDNYLSYQSLIQQMPR